MKNFIFGATTALCLGLSSQAFANLVVVEPIDITIPTGETELVCTEVFDPLHQKELKLDVLAELAVPFPIPYPIEWYFDWFDENGNKFTTPPNQVFVAPVGTTLIQGTHIIDFCPPLISVHFVNPEKVALKIVGTLTHTCLSVPDSGTLVPFLGMLVVGHLLYRRRTHC